MDPNILKSKLPDVSIPDNQSLSEYLIQRSSKYGDKVAMVDAATGKKMTHKELVDNINNVANGLWNYGLRKEDLVFIILPNCIEYAVILHAVIIQGVTVSTCSPVYTPNEIAKQLTDVGATYVFTVNSILPNVRHALKLIQNKVKHIFLVDGDSSYTDLGIHFESYQDQLRGHPRSRPSVTVNPREDCALILYSSGTSGLPKGVMLSHYCVLANIFQHSTSKIRFGNHNDRYICFAPLYHIYGVGLYLCLTLFHGTTVIIMETFDPIKYLECCEKYQVNVLHLVPPVALFLAKHPAVEKFDLSAAKEAFVAGAPVKNDLSLELCNRLNLTFIRQGYGLTEMCPAITFAHKDDWKHGSSGIVLPNTEVKVIDIKNGKSLGIYERGEILAKGPQMMLGYLNNPQATAETIDKDGWLHTGDIGYYDEDGHFFIVDRLKELIKYNAFQVAPAELEALLLTHPGISDAAVIGVPNEATGELPKAYIVLKEGATCTENDIHRFMKKNAAYYKKLRGGITFRKEIPKSPSGKILRRILREELQKEKSKL